MSDLTTYSPFYDEPKDILGMALDSEGDWVHIDKARVMQDEIERLRARVEVLERVREAAQRTQECWGILFAFPLIDKPFEALRAALKDAKP